MNVKIHDMPRNTAIHLEDVCRQAGINSVEEYSDDSHELFNTTIIINEPGVEVKINRQYLCLFYTEGEIIKVHRIHQDDFSEVTII